MIHLRVVAPASTSRQALEVLRRNASVTNVVFLEGAAVSPPGDMLLADVAREDASVVIADLRELRIGEQGSIAIDEVQAEISDYAVAAVERAKGAPADAVVWEQVEAEASEITELSGAFAAFMVLAALIAGVGIYLDSPILVIGAMVVGPEFGPIAGFCVAAATGRRDVALRSAVALAAGFPAAITAVFLASLLFRATGLTPDSFTSEDHALGDVIANPDFFAFFVAACAGAAGMLSLSTAKSGALIGVLISVTTIPAAANIGISLAYQDWAGWLGSVGQLVVNLTAILVAGTATLLLQRVLYRRRRVRHLGDPERALAGLPVGRSMRGRRALESSERGPGGPEG